MATSTERSTNSIPGTENMEFTHETSLHRVSTYPIIKDSLSTAYTIVQSNALLATAYNRAEILSQSILARLLPIVERLPIERVDGYANNALDLLERKFPFVKQETKIVVDKVRSPADNVYAVGKNYVVGVQSLANSATEDLHSRIVKTQEGFNNLLSYIPRDQASLQESYATVSKELDTLRTSITSQISELPATAQTAYQPIVGSTTEALKLVKFRVEFSNNTTNSNTPPAISYAPNDRTTYPTRVTLVMEKGTHSNFKATLNRLRASWKLDDPPNSANLAVKLIPSPMNSPNLSARSPVYA